MTSVAVKTRSTDAVKAPISIRPISSTISRSANNSQVNRQTQTDTRSTADTARLSTLLSPSIQTATRVSSPSDPAELEAEATARAVMQMPSPQTPQITSRGAGIGRIAGTTQTVMRSQPVLARLHSSLLSRSSALSASSDLSIQRVAMRSPTVTTGIEQEIRTEMASGMPLPQDVRSFMEPRFRADFGAVRIHTDDKAARLSARLSARAFTYGKHIFFGKGQFRPNERTGAELIAHELTHTIQQREVIQRQEAVTVTEHSPVQVQRLGVGDALNYFADRANNIPGFRMFTIILGVNPINMTRVERNAANILRAVVEFIPGGALITQALDNHGVFDRVGGWIEQQIRTLAMTGSVIWDAINRFLDSLGWSDIFDLGGVWERAKRIFTEPIDRIISFAGGLASGIIQFVKDAILMPLARLAEGTRGWDLLCAVLGRNPITGAVVPRNAETLIGGFMKLIGQEEVWENIKRSNAVARAWAWFQGALAGVLAFVQMIPSLFIQALRSLQIADIVLLPRAFARIAEVFGGFALRFFSWAGQQVLSLLQIIFEVVAPGAMVYIRRAAGAFRTIIQNPIRFIGNLVRAGILGFRQFGRNFLTHLRTSLIGWLTGTMSANIYIPQAFNLREILKFVLSVFGLTWQNIRGKLVRAIGETAVRAMETGFDIVVTLVREGPAAAWQKIVEAVGNLRDMVMEQIMTFVRDRVVQAAITRLVTSLNPAGAFIQAIIATYNTIMFFVERLQQIAQVAMSFIDSISAIAGGVIASAANRVEQTMGGLLTLVISFLARIAGLGNVAQAVTNIINRVRQPIDRALDRVVEWIVAQARRLGRFVAQAGVPTDPNERLRLGLNAATSAVRALSGNRIGRALIPPLLTPIRIRYGFQTLEPEIRGGDWWIRGVINPNNSRNSGKRAESTIPITGRDLSIIVRRVVVSEIQNNPIVRSRVQQPVGRTIVIGAGLNLPAAALQSREQLQQHIPASGPPFVILAGTRPNEVEIQIGGGSVSENRARAGSTGAPLERVTGFDSERGWHYNPDVLNEIRNSGLSEQSFALNMRLLVQTGRFEPDLTERQRASVRRATWLIYGTESARNIANIVHAPIAVGRVETESATFAQVLSSQRRGISGGILPATMGQLPATARTLEGQLSQSVPGLTPRAGGQTADPAQVQALIDREYNLVNPFVIERTRNNEPSREEAETVVRVYVRQYYQR